MVLYTLYDRENKTIYVFEEFYKSGCQLSELAEAIGNMQIGKIKLYVDAAEPRAIQYFKNNRINAEGCAKGTLAHEVTAFGYEGIVEAIAKLRVEDESSLFVVAPIEWKEL